MAPILCPLQNLSPLCMVVFLLTSPRLRRSPLSNSKRHYRLQWTPSNFTSLVGSFAYTQALKLRRYYYVLPMLICRHPPHYGLPVLVRGNLSIYRAALQLEFFTAAYIQVRHKAHTYESLSMLIHCSLMIYGVQLIHESF